MIGSKAIVLEADDVEALTDELEAKGAKVVWRRIGGTSGIHDSEGNLMTILPHQDY